MNERPLGSIEEQYRKLSDPCQGRNVQLKRIDMIIIAINGMILGADGWVEVENFGGQ